ncbi:MAG: hypothetical protein AB8G99_13695 [Planctomycetaceae bacterium]
MDAQEPNPLGKLILGVLIGVGITYAYVRFGYKPPAVVQLAANVTDKAVSATATETLYSPSATVQERTRALAVYLGKEPEELIDINQSLNGRIMNEALRRKALKQAKVLKQQFSAYDVALKQSSLRRRLEQKYGETNKNVLKRRMLADAIREEEFLCWYLKNTTLELTDESLVNVVLRSYQNELRPSRIAAAPEQRRRN